MPHHNYNQGQGQQPGQQQYLHHPTTIVQQPLQHLPGGAVAAAGRLVRQTSRDSNDGSLHSVSSESSS